MKRIMGFDFSQPLRYLLVQVSFISKLGRHHEVGKGEREKGGGLASQVCRYTPSFTLPTDSMAEN